MSRRAFSHNAVFAMTAASVILVCLMIAMMASIPGIQPVIAWSGDPTANTTICAAGGDQGSPAAVADGYSGTIIVWQDYRSGTDWDIYAQRTDLTGAVQWSDNGTAVCVLSSDQASPDAVSDGHGGAIIVWEDSRNSNRDIYAQRIDPAGKGLWTDNGVPVCTASYDQVSPVLVSDGAGGALAIWQDKRNGTDYDIYIQKIDASGVTQWTADGVAVCKAAFDQTSVVAVSDADGGALVAWQDRRNDTYDIYAQRVDSSCTPLWLANGVGVCTASGHQISPAMVEDGSGGVIIAWTDGRSDTGYDVYGQRLDQAGFDQWTLNGIPVCTAAGDQSSISAIGDGTGGTVLTWQDSRSSIGYDIYGQRVDASGETQWATDGAPVCLAPGDQRSPIMVSDYSAGAVVVWRDSRSESDYDIYGQGVDSTGSARWTADGVPVCTAAEDQGSLCTVSDGSSGAVIVWQDSRNATKDIYAQRVQASGVLSRPPAQPVNLLPADREGGGSLVPTLKCSAFSPTEPGETHLASQWRITANAGDYANPVFDSGPDSFGLLQVTVPSGRLNGNTTYYWQVRHQGSNRLWSPWSPETSFTTMNRPPDQPAGIWPENGASGIGLTPTLQSSPFHDPDVGDTHAASQWRITTAPGDYGNPVFLSPELTSSLTQVTVDSGRLTGHTTYYWQVRHEDNHGVWSGWSEDASFTTMNRTPVRPTPVSPQSRTQGTSLTPTLESSAFSDPDAGDTHAASQWQISVAPGDYSSPVFTSQTDTTNLLSIQVPSGRLGYSATCFWHVRYEDNHGAWSDWSEESSFTTQSAPPDASENHPPDRPVCMAPANGTDNVSTTPTLESSAFHDTDVDDTQAASQWQMTTATRDYQDPTFEGSATANSITVSAGVLNPDTTYYWRVRYEDNHGAWSEWSEESSFTTGAGEQGETTNRMAVTSWIYLGGVIAVAILATAAVVWRNIRAARMASR